jgi:hypothetical protein
MFQDAILQPPEILPQNSLPCKPGALTPAEFGQLPRRRDRRPGYSKFVRARQAPRRFCRGRRSCGIVSKHFDISFQVTRSEILELTSLRPKDSAGKAAEPTSRRWLLCPSPLSSNPVRLQSGLANQGRRPHRFGNIRFPQSKDASLRFPYP